MNLNPLNTDKIKPREDCIASCLKVLGNKWTALILTELADGPKRFSQLERLVAGISPRSLTQRLDALTEYGIVNRAHFKEVPPRTEYSLTRKGQDFTPILQQMSNWGTKHPIS